MVKVTVMKELEKFKRSIGAELSVRMASCRHMCVPLTSAYFFMFPFFDNRRERRGEEKLCIYCDSAEVVFYTQSENCCKMIAQAAEQENPGRCAAAFFSELTKEDIDLLEKLESHIEELEDALLTEKKPIKNTETKIVRIRRRLLSLKRYYEQLGVTLGEVLADDSGFFDKEARHQLKYIEHRVAHLLESVLHLRESITQVREAYQAQIDIEQNQVMKIFTVITAIFLPLTLIVGWYGMNFLSMPELQWRYGYVYVIVLSVAVCSLCMILFKHKKWF